MTESKLSGKPCPTRTFGWPFCSGLLDTMGQAFTAPHEHGVISDRTAGALRSSVGLRNVAVHDYVAVNWKIVQDVIEKHVEVFVEYMREVEGDWAGVVDLGKSEAVFRRQVSTVMARGCRSRASN